MKLVWEILHEAVWLFRSGGRGVPVVASVFRMTFPPSHRSRRHEIIRAKVAKT